MKCPPDILSWAKMSGGLSSHGDISDPYTGSISDRTVQKLEMFDDEHWFSTSYRSSPRYSGSPQAYLALPRTTTLNTAAPCWRYSSVIAPPCAVTVTRDSRVSVTPVAWFSRLHGTARNPYNVNHYTGGSSSGSAAAVAAGRTNSGKRVRLSCPKTDSRLTFGRPLLDRLLSPQGQPTFGRQSADCGPCHNRSSFILCSKNTRFVDERSNIIYACHSSCGILGNELNAATRLITSTSQHQAYIWMSLGVRAMYVLSGFKICADVCPVTVRHTIDESICCVRCVCCLHFKTFLPT